MTSVSFSQAPAFEKRQKTLPLILGFCPVLLLAAIIGALELIYAEHPMARTVFEPPLLLPVLHTTTIFPGSCIVALIAMRSYIRSGSLTILMLGCGTLTLGVGVLPAGWLLGPEGPDVNVAIFNLTVLFSSIFHAAGILGGLMQIRLEPDERRRRHNLEIAYLGVIVLVSFYSLAALAGFLPKFFIQEKGPTAIRQAVLAIAFFLFLTSSTALMARFIQERVHFFYWYSLALALLSISLIGTALQPGVGSPIGWAGRIGQDMGAIYFVFAVVSARKGARWKGLALNDAVAEIFHRSEQKISTIYAHMTDCHCELDRDWRFIRINDRALSYFGGKRDDFIGRSYLEVFSHSPGPVFEQQYRKVLTEGDPVHFEEQSAIVPGKWVEIHAYPVEEGVSVYFRDITERKLMEAELRLSESEFRMLSRVAGDLLASENPQGIVNELCSNVMAHLDCHVFFNFLVDDFAGKLSLNACAGIPEDEAAKIKWLDFGVAVCGCVALGGERIVAENIFDRPDIRTDLVRSYGIRAYACHPLKIGDRVIGTLSFGTRTRPVFSHRELAVMKTVTDQVAVAMERIRLIEVLRKSRDELELRVDERTAELTTYMARLQESNQALQDFASIASHDMQEPLRKVISFGDMLSKEYEGVLGEEGNAYLRRMLDATQRMQALLKGLLEYSRVTTKIDPFVEVDLTKIVGEVLSDLEVRIKRTEGEVRIGELPVIQADPMQMRQLFQNLIGNALKFHKEGEKPLVEVRSAIVDGKLQIVVEDNGIGFEEQYIDRIFAPFQRLHGRDSRYEGTGMGLAICRKIVERHGGTMRAESNPGKGSRFIVILEARKAGPETLIAKQPSS
jgi:PAS domain S-box-containing protein